MMKCLDAVSGPNFRRNHLQDTVGGTGTTSTNTGPAPTISPEAIVPITAVMTVEQDAIVEATAAPIVVVVVEVMVVEVVVVTLVVAKSA